MARRRPYMRQRRGTMDFLWPFLLIILVGIIVALLIQFIFSWLDQKETELKNKIYIYLDQGEGQILPWGETEWSKVYDGELVMEGDVIDLGRLSRGVLSFYNGMSVRLDAETKMDIKDVSNEETGDEFHLSVLNGTLWINVPEEIEMPTRTIVYTDHLKITSYGTIFEVGVTDRETVRVLEGEVLVEVLSEDSDREVVLEQVKVGVGQQVELTAEDWEKISTYQTVSLLEALDDAWKSGDWYAWNIEEDSNPTLYGLEEDTPEEVVETTESTETTESMETATDEEAVEEDMTEQDTTAPTLTLTFPESSPYTLPAGDTFITLTGTVSENTAKVVVTSYDESGAAYPYTLSAYTAGSTTWRYNAAAAYDNLREGRNLFTIVAENADGFESAKIEVVVEVLEGALETEEDESESEEEVAEEATAEETAAEEAVSSEESSEEGESASVEESETESESDSESGSEEGVSTDEPLTTPQVSSLNGEALPSSGTYTTGAESVTILGSVSTSAVAVYVNDYKLSKYVAGSGAWSYYAQPDFLNYDVGENVYVVYAEDAEGNVSVVLTFTIYRESP